METGHKPVSVENFKIIGGIGERASEKEMGEKLVTGLIIPSLNTLEGSVKLDLYN